MIIRPYEPDDLEALKAIHEKHYSHDFELDSFFKNTLGLFSIIDDDGNLVSVGGARLILESVLITDKRASIYDKLFSLSGTLAASQLLAQHQGFDQLHSFIDKTDDVWLKHLKRAGFKPTVGESLVICF